jgi:hypothetical protein
MNNYRLLAALRRHLTPLLPLATPALLLNLALFVLSLAQSPNCHLATLATVLPLDAERDNLVQRLRRWLKTPALSWERYYRPLVRQFLAAWPGSELALVMDRTDVQDRLSLLFVGIATRQRVVLLAWEVLPYGSTAADTQVALLQRIQPLLPDPSHVRITFFGDAEFRAVELSITARKCRAIAGNATESDRRQYYKPQSSTRVQNLCGSPQSHVFQHLLSLPISLLLPIARPARPSVRL